MAAFASRFGLPDCSAATIAPAATLPFSVPVTAANALRYNLDAAPAGRGKNGADVLSGPRP